VHASTSLIRESHDLCSPVELSLSQETLMKLEDILHVLVRMAMDIRDS
jgi:hypothetical protein